MDIWHKYAAVAYLAVFMDVTGHAYQEMSSYFKLPPPPCPPPSRADIGTHVTLWVGKYGFEFR